MCKLIKWLLKSGTNKFNTRKVCAAKGQVRKLKSTCSFFHRGMSSEQQDQSGQERQAGSVVRTSLKSSRASSSGSMLVFRWILRKRRQD